MAGPTSGTPLGGNVGEIAPQQVQPSAKLAPSLSAGARAAIEAATVEVANTGKTVASIEQSVPMRPNNDNVASTSGVGPCGPGLITPMQTPRHPPRQPQPQ